MDLHKGRRKEKLRGGERETPVEMNGSGEVLIEENKEGKVGSSEEGVREV